MMKLLASICLSAGMLATQIAPAMTLSPGGTGQVLLFPYFTVNRHQQVLISVSNLTPAAKIARVRFREAYNGREVLDFDVFLGPQSTWTSALFSLDNAGLSGAGAALLLNDSLCTHPAFATSNKLPSGQLYQPFFNYAYTGANVDTGPTSDTRTREGFFEVVEMAELTGATRTAITPVNGVPPGCASVASGDLPTTDLLPPTGGLSGSEAIVDVPIGTFYATNATALDGVYNRAMYTSPDFSRPDLRDASAAANGFVTAYVPLNGSLASLNYPPTQAIDAASALLAASQIITDYDVSASAGAQTDWVVTFPTKHFYVDPLLVTNKVQATAPFDELFGANTPGHSDVDIGLDIFDRSGKDLFDFNDTTHPPVPLPPPLPYETQVVMFASQNQPLPLVSPALAAANPLSVVLGDAFSTGVMHLTLSSGDSASPHLSRPSHEGLQLQGLPVIGFEAINYVNANATPGVLANYSAVLPMRARAPCLVNSGTSANATCP